MTESTALLRTLALLMVSALVLAGCSTSGPLKKPDGPGLSIVFGYIDMDDAPVNLQWISMKQMQPRSDKPYYNFYVDDGMFYRAHVPPGAYKFWEFGGHSGWKNTSYTFSFPTQGKGDMDRQVTGQGVYFAGCYKYRKVKTGFFKPGEFDLEPMGGSCEKEMLARLEKWAADPEWKRLVAARLAELH